MEFDIYSEHFAFPKAFFYIFHYVFWLTPKTSTTEVMFNGEIIA